jgi:hypothetical protein
MQKAKTTALKHYFKLFVQSFTILNGRIVLQITPACERELQAQPGVLQGT